MVEWRGMGRRLFNIVTALSLLLGVAVAGLWVRSYFAGDHVSVIRISSDGQTKHYCFLESSAGGLYCCTGDFTILHPFDVNEHEDMRPSQPIRWSVDRHPRYPHIPIEGRRLVLGMDWVTLHELNAGSNQSSEKMLIVPHAWIVLLLLLLPGLRGILWGRNKWRQKRNAGLCAKCGYDLRASTERCPECGTPIHAEASA